MVDNNSVDKTVLVARQYLSKKKIFNLKNYQKFLNPRGEQLNLGVKKAKTSLIFFPDADMRFSLALINEAIFKLNDLEFDALYVPEKILGKNIFHKVRNFERSFYNQTPIDAVRFVKKKIFKKIGGFDSRRIMFGADDWDFTLRLKIANYKLGITKNFLIHDESNLNLMQYINKKTKYFNCFS